MTTSKGQLHFLSLYIGYHHFLQFVPTCLYNPYRSWCAKPSFYHAFLHNPPWNYSSHKVHICILLLSNKHMHIHNFCLRKCNLMEWFTCGTFLLELPCSIEDIFKILLSAHLSSLPLKFLPLLRPPSFLFVSLTILSLLSLFFFLNQAFYLFLLE